MPSLNGRRVRAMKLAKAAHAPGIGAIGPTVTLDSSGKLTEVEMVYVAGEGVYFRCKGVEMLFSQYEHLEFSPEKSR